MKFKYKPFIALISVLVSLVLCSSIQVNSNFSQKSPVNNLESSASQAPISIDGMATGVGGNPTMVYWIGNIESTICN